MCIRDRLCRLYPDISLHVDYDGRTALGINPFDLQGEELANGSIEMLSGVCLLYTSRSPRRGTPSFCCRARRETTGS